MFPHAANPAAQPNSSLHAPQQPSCCSAEEHGYGGSLPSFPGHGCSSGKSAVMAHLRHRETMSDLCPLKRLPSRIPSSARVHASGPFRRPAARRRSASAAPPFQGLGSSQKKFESRSKERCINFFRAPPRKHSLALGSRAHSLASLGVTRAGYGKFKRNGDHHHVHQQSHPHRLRDAQLGRILDHDDALFLWNGIR